MGQPQVAPPFPEEPSHDSFLSRLIGVFTAPGATFESIALKPGFVGPIVTIAIAAWVAFDTMWWKVGMETMTRLTLERNPFASRMTPEQMEQAVANSAGHLTRQIIITDALILIVTIVFLLILAGLGMLFVKVVFGAEARFKTLFSVASYAQLPTILGYVMSLVVVLFGGTDNLDPQNPVPLNLAFFLNYKEVPKPLFALAGSVDILIVWMIILLGIGMSQASGGKVKATSVTLCFVGAWAVWIIGKVGFAAIF